jgi:hypothetical protein
MVMRPAQSAPIRTSSGRVLRRLIVAGLVGVSLACTAAPLDRPVKLGPIDSGPGSVEFARRQLEGAWTLELLEIVDTKGIARPVRSTGRLTVDAFGNMAMSGRLIDPAPGDRPEEMQPIVEYKGRLIIDPDRHEFRLDAPVAAVPVDNALAKAVSPTLVRRYTITDDRLVVTVTLPDGSTSARTSFRKER